VEQALTLLYNRRTGKSVEQRTETGTISGWSLQLHPPLYRLYDPIKLSAIVFSFL
jgi:hypothetical protein